MQLRLTGRAPAQIIVEPLGPLTLAEVQTVVRQPAEARALTRISERHHALARSLAGGVSVNEAAAMYGYTASTISILQGDPAFQNLLQIYKGQLNFELRGLGEKIAGISHEAIDLINERLEDPESRSKISVGQALSIAQFGADRVGFGPSSTQVNVNVGLADRLAAARKRAREASGIIDITPTEVSRDG